jgi:hypothetical protein
MKKCICILLLLLISSIAVQAEDTIKEKRSYRLSFTTLSRTTSLEPEFLFGLKFEIFPRNWFSIEYNFLFGGSNGNFVCHTNAGTFWGLKTFFESMEDQDSGEDWDDEDPLAWGLLLLIVIPEGINFYVPYSRNIYLVPFISPLGYDYIDGIESMSSGAGMKMDIRLSDRLSIVPAAGVKYIYELAKPSYFLGLSIGVTF